MNLRTDRYLSRRNGRCRRSSPARLRYLRNRVDDCRLLREMDVAVHAWHWRATFATAKKLPSLAAGTAAILVRRIAEARNGPCQIYGTTRRCFPFFNAIWSPDHLCSSCASCRQCGRGWLTYLYEPLVLPNCWPIVSFAVVAGFRCAVAPGV